MAGSVNAFEQFRKTFKTTALSTVSSTKASRGDDSLLNADEGLYTRRQPTEHDKKKKKKIFKLYSWKQSTVLQLDTHDE